MRQFYFVIFNEEDKIVDRYNLDIVTDISGLGYSLALSTVSGEVADYVTKVIQQKKNLSFIVQHLNKYVGYTSLCNWLESHIDDNLLLAYTDGNDLLYCSGYVLSTSKTEIDEYGVLKQKIDFKPLEPFFEKIDNDIYISVSAIGKNYPFKYPYSYGKNVVENNSINNTYIKDIPINVVIFGGIDNPIIKLLDEKGNVYNEVRFKNASLLSGEKIIINSAQKKIYFDNGTGTLVDYYDHVDEAYDSYLRAKPLVQSKIAVNLQVSDSGKLVGSRRQYKLR